MAKKGKTNRTVKMEVDSIGRLSGELITDILSRLPAKVLCKFRCVSKQWLNLISDPYFLNLHRHRSERNPLLLFLAIERGTRINCTLHLSTIDMNGTFHTDVVFNDDVIYRSFPCSSLILFEGFHYIYISNPSVNEFVRLLDSDRSSHSGWVPYYGFGFLPSTNEYKIVRLFSQDLDFSVSEYDDDSDYDDIEISCEIFTVRNGGMISSWKSLELIWPSQIWRTFDSLCVNGVIYWMHSSLNHDRKEVLKITSLDLEKEEFGTVVDPLGYSGQWFLHLRLVELKGFLCVSVYSATTITMDIWVLKDYKNSVWEKEYTIDFSIFHGCSDLSLISPVDIRNREILVMVERRSFHYYSIEDKSFRRAEFSIEQAAGMSSIVFESLFSLGT